MIASSPGSHRLRRPLGIAGLCLGALLSSACGWHAGLLAPEGVPADSSVGVEIFGNTSPEPDLEADLARHLSGALVDFVALEFESPESADLIIRGALTGFTRRNGIRSQDNELLEGSVRIDVEASLVHRVSGKVLRTARQGLWADWATGTPGLSGPGIGERPARERVLQNVADRLILDLFAHPADEENEPSP